MMTKAILIPILLIARLAAAQTLEVAASITLTEGPTVDAAGNVFFTGNGRINKLSTDGKLSIFRDHTSANGLIFDGQWRLLACEGGDGRVTRTGMKTGKIEVLAERFQGKRFRAPNDLTIDNKGRIYFTDRIDGYKGAPDLDRVDKPGVYRIDGDGKVSRILTSPEIQVPNGVSISPDDRTFYLVESNQDKDSARMIRAYDLQADGSVRNMRVFHNFYPGRSADGLAIDVQGNLYAAAGLNFLRGTSETLDTKCGVYVFSPKGEQLRFIPIPEDLLTNLAFGGPDMKTLYITSGKSLFRVKVDVAGTRR
jgi:gluconolactonase